MDHLQDEQRRAVSKIAAFVDHLLTSAKMDVKDLRIPLEYDVIQSTTSANLLFSRALKDMLEKLDPQDEFLLNQVILPKLIQKHKLDSTNRANAEEETSWVPGSGQTERTVVVFFVSDSLSKQIVCQNSARALQAEIRKAHEEMCEEFNHQNHMKLILRAFLLRQSTPRFDIFQKDCRYFLNYISFWTTNPRPTVGNMHEINLTLFGLETASGLVEEISKKIRSGVNAATIDVGSEFFTEDISLDSWDLVRDRKHAPRQSSVRQRDSSACEHKHGFLNWYVQHLTLTRKANQL